MEYLERFALETVVLLEEGLHLTEERGADVVEIARFPMRR